MTTQNEIDTAPLDDDVKCVKCAYNLRGLQRTGKCPECAEDIAPSYRLHLIKLSKHYIDDPLERADPRWIDQLFIGAGLLLAALLLRLLTLAAPWAWEWQTRPRAYVLGVLVAAWVFEWFGIWKLATNEPHRPHSVFSLPNVLRGCASAYFLLPFLNGLKHQNAVQMLLAITGLLGGIVASILFYILLRRLGCRFRSTLPISATILIGLAPVAFFLSILPELDAPVDSLSKLSRSASVACAPFESLQWIANRDRFPLRHPIEWLVASYGIFVSVAHIQLYFGLRQARIFQLRAVKK